jgi:hypothetical protein
MLGQVGPATGSDTTLIAFGTTFVTVAGGIVVGYLALIRDRRKDAQQTDSYKDQLSELLVEHGKLIQAVEDLTNRVDRLERKPSRGRRTVKDDNADSA